MPWLSCGKCGFEPFDTWDVLARFRSGTQSRCHAFQKEQLITRAGSRPQRSYEVVSSIWAFIECFFMLNSGVDHLREFLLGVESSPLAQSVLSIVETTANPSFILVGI